MPSDEAREVLLILTDAGGGHRAAANALIAAGEELRTPLRFRVLRLQDALAAADFTRGLLGPSMEDTYNAMVRRGWTRFLVPLLRTLHFLIGRLHARLVGLLAARLAQERPVVVVSLMPNFNGVIRDAVHRAHPGVPLLVLLTDYADFPPHFWLEPGIDRAIVATEHAARQAVAAGLPPERVSRVSGLPLHPRHYVSGGPASRSRTRLEHGIAAGDFVAMILFGGKGSPEILPLTKELLAREACRHAFVVCGDNPSLEAALRRLAASSGGGSLHVHGFTDRVADLMAASDVLLTKPGPGSLAEAFHHGVPVVVTCNARTVPQERWNAQWIRGQGLGLVVDDWREMADAAAILRSNREWSWRLRRAIQSLPRNRAVYEALEIIQAEAGVAAHTRQRERIVKV
jgi:1,2-diacylglycerol 3-beta-galactosyltransferase